MSQPVIAMCIYRVRSGREDAFLQLLRQHWPTLRDLGLASEEESTILRGEEEGGSFFVELLPWRDDSAPGEAHKYPQVVSLWGPIEDLCEPRGGRPAVEFPHVQRVNLHAPRELTLH
ncbi:MAG: hypothetical protein ABJA82_16035 [Myxococcales bacterium]